MIRAITIYSSSSNTIALEYLRAGEELGRAIAQHKWTLVYGGNSLGLMKAVADGARAAGGKVIGITPQIFVDDGCCDPHCDEFIITPDMRQRKQLLEQRGDAFIALPGGIGTLEEILEIIAGRSLRFHDKPIVLLNIAGYWDPLLAMIERGIEQHFIKPRCRNLYFVAKSVQQAMDYLTHPQSPGL
ncbi:MAG TPA: TIGR00730 family Rossman fold protein [Tepidisphaeraceae bacterium]|nr:TIGR00730 family Rossman fold protein [Tepidisphaeraceae bacterium]